MGCGGGISIPGMFRVATDKTVRGSLYNYELLFFTSSGCCNKKISSGCIRSYSLLSKEVISLIWCLTPFSLYFKYLGILVKYQQRLSLCVKLFLLLYFGFLVVKVF